MKKFKSFLISISIFLFYTNNAYATTTGRYTVKESSGFGKIFLLIMAIGLVALVLYIGYKMDKNDAQKKRKERIESNKKKQEQKIYDEENRLEKNVVNSYNFEDKENIKPPKINTKPRVDKKRIEKIEEIDELEENLVEEFLEENIIKSIIDKNIEDEKQEFTRQLPTVSDFAITSDSTMVVNTNDIKESLLKHHDDELEEIEDDVVDNDNYEVNEQYEENSEDENDGEYEDDDEIDYENEDLTRIKSVFEGNIRGYDFDEDDLELLDLEQTIAAANIKKYKKVAQMVKPVKPVKNKKKNSNIIKNDNSNLKRYTRKKQVEEIKTAKRYTRKKKEEVAKSKRFTLKKENKPEKVEKVKRGRKPKNQVENNIVTESVQVKSKRGRKPSDKKEEGKSKRGRKPSTEKTESKSKRGRKPSSKK